MLSNEDLFMINEYLKAHKTWLKAHKHLVVNGGEQVDRINHCIKLVDDETKPKGYTNVEDDAWF
jgi:hypothetical protein